MFFLEILVVAMIGTIGFDWALRVQVQMIYGAIHKGTMPTPYKIRFQIRFVLMAFIVILMSLLIYNDVSSKSYLWFFLLFIAIIYIFRASFESISELR